MYVLYAIPKFSILFYILLNNQRHLIRTTDVSRDMKFPTMLYVRPAKPHFSLRIPAVWSEPLLVVWIFFEC